MGFSKVYARDIGNRHRKFIRKYKRKVYRTAPFGVTWKYLEVDEMAERDFQGIGINGVDIVM